MEWFTTLLYIEYMIDVVIAIIAIILLIPCVIWLIIDKKRKRK